MSNTVNYLASFGDIPKAIDTVLYSKLTFIACESPAVAKAMVTSLQTRFKASVICQDVRPNVLKVFNYDSLDK